MKLSIPLALALCCLFNTAVLAQKTKAGKTKPKTTKTSNKVKFTPPKIVKDEEVIADEKPPDLMEEVSPSYYEEKSVAVEAPASYDAPSSYSSKKALEKTPFDAAGKYYLVTVKTSDYYSSYRYGIDDNNGKTILPPVFSEIKNIDAGIRLKLGYLSGLVDNDFKTLLPLEFETLSSVKGTKWLITGNGYSSNSSKLIDNKGVQIVPGEYYSISEVSSWNSPTPDGTNYLLFSKKEGSKALYDCKKKKFTTDFTITDVRYTNNASIIVFDKSGARLYDNNMVPVTNDLFENINTTAKNVLIVTKNKKKGLMTTEGEYILPCEYDVISQAGIYDLGCFVAGKSGKFICIDYLGKNILEETYDTISTTSYQNSNLFVTKGGKMGVKDILNHTILPIEFDTIISTSYKYLTQKGNKFSYYSTTGTFMNDFDCDKIEPFSYYYKLYYKKKKVGIMNTEYTKLSEPIYDKIEPLGSEYYSSGSEERFKVAVNGKYGVISKNAEVIPVIYDQILKLNKALIVKQNGKYGLIRTSDSKLIAPCKYDYISNDGGSSDTKFIAIEGANSTTVNLYY